MVTPFNSTCQKKSLRSQLLQDMLQAILSGELPGGQWLIEQEVAQRFGVSRTPIREAINKLAGLGLIEIHANRGALLWPFGPRELREIYAVRAVLEAHAAHLAAAYVNKRDLIQLADETRHLLSLRSNTADWAQREIDLDRRVHALVSHISGNLRLEHEVKRYYELIEAIRERLGRQYDAQRQAAREHLEIIEKLLAGDGQQAAQTMNQHIVNAGEQAVGVIYS